MDEVYNRAYREVFTACWCECSGGCDSQPHGYFTAAALTIMLGASRLSNSRWKPFDAGGVSY